jgi:hypothetical protein
MFQLAANSKDSDTIQQDHGDTLNEIGDLLIVLQDYAFKEGALAQRKACAEWLIERAERDGMMAIAFTREEYAALKELAEQKKISI